MAEKYTLNRCEIEKFSEKPIKMKPKIEIATIFVRKSPTPYIIHQFTMIAATCKIQHLRFLSLHSLVLKPGELYNWARSW